MSTVVTGSQGFLGRHLTARLKAAGHAGVIGLGRGELVPSEALERTLAGAREVVHLAGVNRDTEAELHGGNLRLAEVLVSALEATGSTPRIVYANSVQAAADNPYGRGKREASQVLAAWAHRAGADYVDLVLPNLFGECGRPYYNSFVATFCWRLAHGQEPQIDVDRELELLHAQDAAACILAHLSPQSPSGAVCVPGTSASVGEILARLKAIAQTYPGDEFPDLSDSFDLQLFNTYRSYLYPQAFPRTLTRHADPRGEFYVTTKSLGGQSQSSFSTTVPGMTRGNHFHLRKVERFAVIKGEGRLDIRPVWSEKAMTFTLSGHSPAYVDIPTLCAHNITNVGDEPLYTIFWINEVFDPTDADTFAEHVS